MPTVAPGSSYTNSLQPGNALTVVTTTGTALIERRSPGLSAVEKTAVSAASTITLGPYLQACSVRVVPFVAPCDASQAISDAQVVVGSAAPSNADGRPDGTIYIQTA